MKVVEEPISVLRDYGEAELTLLMGGYRVAMTSQEARTLVHIVNAALTEAAGEGGQSRADGVAGGAPDHAAIVAKVAEQVISWSQIAAAAQRK